MQAINPAVVKINKTDVNVMTVDTGLYPDVGIADILAYNHIDNPSAQGTTLKVGLAGRVGLLTNGLPAIPVILFGNRYPTVGSLVLYKMTVMTKEQEFTASVTGGATVTATADGLVVQMPATPGDVVLTVNHYAFRIVVQDQSVVNPYIADHIVTGNGIIPNVDDYGFGNAVVISKDGNWLITGIQGFDTDGVTPLKYLVVFNKLQNGNKYLWQLHATLAPVSADTGPAFAFESFDINSDGTRIVVGACDSIITTGAYSPISPSLDAGDLTTYLRNGNVWDAGSRITLPGLDSSTFKSLGFTVAMSDDGSRIVASAPALNNFSETSDVLTGVYIIDLDNTTGLYSIKQRISGGEVNERIQSKVGYGLAISGDGTKIFSTNFFLSAGQYVCRVEEFVRDINSFPSTPTRSYLYDTSFRPLSFPDTGALLISEDTNTIVIGFSYSDVNEQRDVGRVDILKRQNGIWVKHSQLVSPSGIQMETHFGAGIDISPDANYIFVGESRYCDMTPAKDGSVHVFKYDAQTDTYSAIECIRSENNYPGGAFGWSISYDRVSKYLAVRQEADGPSTFKGSIYYIPVSALVV